MKLLKIALFCGSCLTMTGCDDATDLASSIGDLTENLLCAILTCPEPGA